MGLTVSHGCFDGSYSRFNWWRYEIAKAIDLPLSKMDGYFVAEEGEPLAWTSLRPDIIHILLNHSDWQGIIAATECLPLANRLDEILPILSDAPEADAKSATRQFITGLRLAAAKHEAVVFI